MGTGPRGYIMDGYKHNDEFILLNNQLVSDFNIPKTSAKLRNHIVSQLYRRFQISNAQERLWIDFCCCISGIVIRNLI